MEEFKVKGDSDFTKIAGATAYAVRRDGRCRLIAIGAMAVHTAAKACAVSRGHLLTSGIDPITTITFRDIQFENGDTRVALVFEVEVAEEAPEPKTTEATTWSN